MDTLDWGQVTPEAAELDRNEFLYVFNHDVTSDDKLDRTVRFIVGRLQHYDDHLPKNPIHNVKIDIHGQDISAENCTLLISQLKGSYSRTEFLEVTLIK